MTARHQLEELGPLLTRVLPSHARMVQIPAGQRHVGSVQRLPLSGETNRLASIYQQKLAALDELKKSLLHQAFSGEL